MKAYYHGFTEAIDYSIKDVRQSMMEMSSMKLAALTIIVVTISMAENTGLEII